MVNTRESPPKGQTIKSRRYYVYTVPYSRSSGFWATYRVPKALFGNFWLSKISKMYDYDLYRNVWDIKIEKILKKLTWKYQSGVLRDYSSDDVLHFIKNIRIHAGTNLELGFRHIVIEFQGKDQLSDFENKLDGLSHHIMTGITHKRKDYKKNELWKISSRITYNSIRPKHDTSRIHEILLFLQSMPYSQLPKDPFKNWGCNNKIKKPKVMNKVQELVDCSENLLCESGISKWYAWFLELGIDFGTKNDTIFLAGSPRQNSSDHLNLSNITLVEITNGTEENFELYDRFDIFEDATSENYLKTKNAEYLRSVFNGIIKGGQLRMVFYQGLSNEIDEFENELNKLNIEISSNRNWSKGKLLIFSNEISSLLIRSMGFQKRIEAYENKLNKSILRPTELEFKMDPKLFPYYDSVDFEMASMTWKIRKGKFSQFPNIEPQLFKYSDKSLNNDTFGTILYKDIKAQLKQYSIKVGELSQNLIEKSKGFEQVVIGVHNERLLFYNRLLFISTIILVILTAILYIQKII